VTGLGWRYEIWLRFVFLNFLQKGQKIVRPLVDTVHGPAALEPRIE
jgi:hypothetical protein